MLKFPKLFLNHNQRLNHGARKGNKRGRSSKDSKRTARKAASKKARKLKKKSTQVGNPNKLGKKCFRYEQNSKLAKGISGKINNNIEALMAAKVLQVEGHMIMKDLQRAGSAKNTVLKKLQRIKEIKHKKRHIKPEKVNVPRI